MSIVAENCGDRDLLDKGLIRVLLVGCYDQEVDQDLMAELLAEQNIPTTPRELDER